MVAVVIVCIAQAGCNWQIIRAANEDWNAIKHEGHYGGGAGRGPVTGEQLQGLLGGGGLGVNGNMGTGRALATTNRYHH